MGAAAAEAAPRRRISGTQPLSGDIADTSRRPKGGGQTPFLEKSELWVADLESGRSELLLRGFAVTGYDISEGGRRVVFAAVDEKALTHLWLAATDHRFPRSPRSLRSQECASSTTQT